MNFFKWLFNRNRGKSKVPLNDTRGSTTTTRCPSATYGADDQSKAGKLRSFMDIVGRNSGDPYDGLN